MADTQITGTLSADEPISGGLSANEGINAELTPNEEISGALEVKRTQEIIQAVWGTITGTLSDQTDLQDALDGKADLENGKVPSSQLPSYVDDVLEYASLSVFPATGEAGKIYIALDTNKTYRWSGSTYVEISESLALGETAGTAYEGSKGKANADAIAKAYKTDDSAETDIQDADYIPFYDTSATAKKKSLWSNIKAKLNEIFFRRSEANILGAKNLLPLTTTAIGGDNIWTIMDDGMVVANGTPSANAQLSIRIPDGLSGNFLFSGCPEGGTGATYDLYSWDSTTSARPKKWDGTTRSDSDYGGTSQEIQIPSGHRVSINCRVCGNFTANNLVFKPMLRLATDADDTFEPYAMTNKEITDKFGTLGSASTKDVPASGDAGQTEVVLGSDTRLTDARTPTAHTHITADITDFPTLAAVATSGNYSDLTGTPTIPDELADLSDDSTHRLVTDTEKSAWNNKCDNSVIAPVESGTTASRAYVRGEHFIKDGAFCTVISDISVGVTLTLNSNYEAGQINLKSILSSRILTSSDNMDNITDFGVYSWSSGNSPSNSPVISSNTISAGCLVLRFASMGTIQVVFNDVYIVFRVKSGNTWTSWRRIAGTT